MGTSGIKLVETFLKEHTNYKLEAALILDVGNYNLELSTCKGDFRETVTPGYECVVLSKAKDYLDKFNK